jgi:hypothetical protein
MIYIYHQERRKRIDIETELDGMEKCFLVMLLLHNVENPKIIQL